jgi:hypothetical protein
VRRGLSDGIEGGPSALTSAAAADRRVSPGGESHSAAQGWPAPFYQSVRGIQGLYRGLLAMALHVPAVFREEFELVLRRESMHPVAVPTTTCLNKVIEPQGCQLYLA